MSLKIPSSMMCRYLDSGRTLEIYCKSCGHNMRLSLPLSVTTLTTLTEAFSAEHRDACPTDASSKVQLTDRAVQETFRRAAAGICSYCGNPENSTTCQRSHP